MSLDATRWAWRQKVTPTRKLVLLSLADRADENHVCYPSISRLEADTGLYRETIMEAIAELESLGLLVVKRRSGTSSIYQLVGVEDRHADEPVWKSRPVGKTRPVGKSRHHQSEKADRHQSEKADCEPISEPIKEPVHVNDDVNNTRAQKNENVVVVDATPPLASQPKTTPPDPVTARAIEIAIMLRQRGAALQHSDPRVIAWAREGFSDAQLLTALETAQRQRAERNSTQPVNAGYLDAIVRENARAAATGKPSTASKERFDPLTYILSKRDSYKRTKEMENDPTLAGRIRRVAHSDGGFVCNFDIEIDGEDNDGQSVVDASLRA